MGTEQQQERTEKPEVTEEHKETAKEMAKAYDEDRPTSTLPGSGGTVSGTAVTDWVDEKDKGKDKLDLDKIPKNVMDSLKAKFPKAKIHKWTKEKDGDNVVYDVEFLEKVIMERVAHPASDRVGMEAHRSF